MGEVRVDAVTLCILEMCTQVWAHRWMCMDITVWLIDHDSIYYRQSFTVTTWILCTFQHEYCTKVIQYAILWSCIQQPAMHTKLVNKVSVCVWVCMYPHSFKRGGKKPLFLSKGNTKAKQVTYKINFMLISLIQVCYELYIWSTFQFDWLYNWLTTVHAHAIYMYMC